MSWVRPLEEVAGDDVSVVGGKAAHLGKLIGAGFSVPSGFVITADAFRAHYPNVSRTTKPTALRALQADLLASVDEQFTTTFTTRTRRSPSVAPLSAKMAMNVASRVSTQPITTFAAKG